MTAAIHVNLITGFLGSGKTTLLQRLLASPDLHSTAVLVNEFGEVSLDHHLLERVDEAMVLLKSGCVCCTIRGDLRDSIRELYDRRERGIVPAFDRLAIETTGLADPAPIVATLMGDPVIRYHFRLRSIVTVVDAKNGQSTLTTYEESRKQVAVADRIVLSKTDIVAQPIVDELRRHLRRLNRTAAQLDAGKDLLSPATLLVQDFYDSATKGEEVRRWLAEHVEPEESDTDHGHGHDVNRHAGDIVSFCLSFEAPLDWSAFAIWLTMLLNRYGESILRLKGMLHVAGVSTPVVIHGVQHTIHPPVHLEAWPEGVAGTRIVFIVKGLVREQLQESLEAFDRLARVDQSSGVAEYAPMRSVLTL